MNQLSFISDRGALFSPCRCYRYSLWRIWGNSEKYVNFVCLNPSTADATKDDPTIRRCMNYSKDWGYDGVYITNLFAFCATDPKIMKASADPIGPDNNNHLMRISRDTSLTILAWGNNGTYLERDNKVHRLTKDPHYLALTNGGCWGHPLYLSKTLKPLRCCDAVVGIEEVE